MSALSDLRFAYLATGPPLRCGLCGIPHRALRGNRPSEALEIAHLFSRGATGPPGNDTANVILLCFTCHRAHHHSRFFNSTRDRSPWPNVTTAMLLLAKSELGELDIGALASITTYTGAYLRGLLESAAFPKHIADERSTWSFHPTGVTT